MVRAVPAAPVVPAAREAPAERVARVAQCSARLADAYANPIMVDALILGREGTIVVPDPPIYYAPALPAHR